MIFLRYTAGTVLLLLLVGCRDKAILRSALESGEYLSAEYMNRVRTIRSTLMPSEMSGVNLIQVRNEKARTYFQFLNFHEGAGDFVLSGRNLISDDGGVPAEITIVSATEFRIRYTETEAKFLGTPREFRTIKQVKQTYQRVGSASEWVATVLLTGEYRDNQGRRYVIDRRHALFPETEFDYEVGLDHVLTGFDYIWTKEKVYEFRIRGNILELREVFGEAPYESPAPEPKWRLTRRAD